MEPLSLVVDFDGTLALADVGNELCDRFAPPRWREVNQRWRDGTLRLDEVQREIWGLVRGEPAEIMAHALRVGTLRPDVDDFLGWAAERGHRLTLVSGGFDFYVEALLGPARLARFSARHVSHGRLEGGGVTVEFARRPELACDRMPVCKGKVCRAAGPGAVVFIGDGRSDRCAIGEAEVLCAVRGSWLDRECEALDAPRIPFERFAEVIAALEQLRPEAPSRKAHE